MTATASAVFFWSRVIHAPSYIAAVPVVRTVVFFVGWIACFVLGYQLLIAL
ncbi:MAG: hypothetical protein GY822_16990 [Deltaproteobacteria bacterium]|nr:hypothetical protein [Deltaproteobacteria bacterium]